MVRADRVRVGIGQRETVLLGNLGENPSVGNVDAIFEQQTA
ncbi:MAG TPA: hypothetical protein PKV27_08645 [Ilumatobacteraceae bacterium]|nr:hypothetical protein [Ilumatobacteraceae bacterium]